MQKAKSLCTRHGCENSTQVSVAEGSKFLAIRHTGLKSEQVEYPNCSITESTAHLCICPSKNTTSLYLETTELTKDEKTEPELAFWIAKYIYTGERNKKHLRHGAYLCMSLEMRNWKTRKKPS